jgi:hypothetical protein
MILKGRELFNRCRAAASPPCGDWFASDCILDSRETLRARQADAASAVDRHNSMTWLVGRAHIPRIVLHIKLKEQRRSLGRWGTRELCWRVLVLSKRPASAALISAKS